MNSTSPIGGTGQTWETALPRIQDAINSAGANDEIWVAAGVYHENLTLRDGVSLFGGFSGNETNRSERNWNIHSTILDGSHAGRVVSVSSTSIPTRLDGFVIQNGEADFGAGIYSAGGQFISANNLVIDNFGTGVFGGGGIFVDETVRLAAPSPIQFFTNLADRLLQLHSPDLSASRIQIFPTNRYSAEVHRLLQVAANIYDATTNRGPSYPYLPSVFRPVFTNENGNVFISGYLEATNDAFLTNQWLSLDSAIDRALLGDSFINVNANLYGQPIIIGAKKGFPNFNEFSIETIAQVTRQLQVRKQSTNFPPVFLETNQMYTLSVSNIIGVESWNSYAQAFPRPLTLHVSNSFTASITDESGSIIWPPTGLPLRATFSSNQVISIWPGVTPSGSNSFVLPNFANVVTLPLSQSLSTAPHFNIASTNFENGAGFPVPKWFLNLTNRIEYWAIDNGSVVDFVSLKPVVTQIDLTRELLGPTFESFVSEPSPIASLWNTNRINGSTNIENPPLGVFGQLHVGMGDIPVGDSDWSNFNGISGLFGSQKDRAIATFRSFMGLTPFPPYQNIAMPSYLVSEVPFAPTRKFYHRVSLQANDPLVHFLTDDLRDLTNLDLSFLIIPPVSPYLPTSNLRRLNERYRPNSPYAQGFSYAPSFEDAGIHNSQDWNFPTNNEFNLHWLDRVHRGTPWQTVYTGFDSFPEPGAWENWSGSAETHPTNDWKIIERFMAERNSFGTSSSTGSPVFANNTIAINSAITGGAASFAASATFINNIVAENSSGLSRLAVTNVVLLQTNCVFGNDGADYANLPDAMGNLTTNPRFISPASHNFRLLATSPCVDMADGTGFASGFLLDEPARLQGTGLDLGAFELSPSDPPVFGTALVNAPNEFTFQVTGFSGEQFVVERSEDLIHWIPFSTNLTVNGFFAITEGTGTVSNRFYRAIRLP